MKDEEFVKLKHWLDAEITILHVMWAVTVIFLAHNKWVTIGAAVYIFFSLVYAYSRLAFVESKHRGYLRIPPRSVDYE